MNLFSMHKQYFRTNINHLKKSKTPFRLVSIIQEHKYYMLKKDLLLSDC